MTITALVLAALATVASADGGERRHASGIVLLPPTDLAEITRQGPIAEPLGKAWSDARDLAQMNPDVLGYPWADRAKGELVIAVVNAQGDAIARGWMSSGAARNLGKPAPSLLPPRVPVRLRTVARSFRQLQAIQNEAIGTGATGYDGDNRIWTSSVDEEHQRVVLETDRVVDAFLFALAKKYGTDVIAVRVDPHAGPARAASTQSADAAGSPSDDLAVAGALVALAAAGAIWFHVWKRRRPSLNGSE